MQPTKILSSGKPATAPEFTSASAHLHLHRIAGSSDLGKSTRTTDRITSGQALAGMRFLNLMLLTTLRRDNVGFIQLNANLPPMLTAEKTSRFLWTWPDSLTALGTS